MSFTRKVPEGFIRVMRQGAPQYVRPWFKELSERSRHEFLTGKEAGLAICKRMASLRHAETRYTLPEMAMAA